MRRFLLPIVLNQGTTLLFGMLGISLISHLVPKRVYGAYGLFLTLTQVGLLLTHSGVTNHATRYWQREHSQSGAYARFLLGRAWVQTASLAALLLAVTLILSVVRHTGLWVQMWPLLVASNLVIAMSGLASLALNASERHWGVFSLNALTTAARSFFPVGLALLIGPTLFALSLGFTLHAIAVGVVILVLFRGTPLARATDPQVEAKWRMELREFGRPFVWMGLGGWLLLNADRWVVEFVFGEEPLGLFNLASNVASIVPNIVVAGLLQWVFPGVFRLADAARTVQDWRQLARRCDQVTLLFLAVTLAGLICLALIGPHLIPWLISDRYAHSMALVLPTGMAAAATQANQFQYLLLQGQHDSKSMVKVLLVLATIRTVGTVIAAAISWPMFLGWLMASTVLISLLGRFAIQRIAFRKVLETAPDRVLDSVV